MRPPVIDLYCLPCAGASAAMYLRWRRSMPSWINVVPVELPGRGTRLGEPFEQGFQTLVTRLCDELSPGDEKRWALFGHSMGALLAYGITLRLHSMGTCLPAILFASGCPSPAYWDLSRFPDTHSDAALIADLHKQGGTPAEVFASPELLGLTLDALRADYRVCESFNYCKSHEASSVAIPIHVLAGRYDAITLPRIEAWRDEARDRFALTWFDGGHFFIREHEQQVLATVVQGLSEVLKEERHVRTVIA